MRGLGFSFYAILLAVALPPLAVFAACRASGLAAWPSLACAVGSAMASCGAGSWLLLRGVGAPMLRLRDCVGRFTASGFKLDSPLPRSGWGLTASLTSAVNRLMLELSAFRGFRLDQVLDERAKAEALIETITDGVLLTDDSWRVLYANHCALSLLGIPKLSGDVVLPGAIGTEPFRRAAEEMAGAAGNQFKTEVVLPAEDGDFSAARTFLFLARHFKLATFRRPGRVLVLRDVTMEKEIEGARETFFHMLTHDMRAPLASIQGYAQMLERQVNKDPLDAAGKYLQAIQRSAARLNGMIADILNTIKLERGEMALEPAELDGSRLCSDLFEVYDPLAARKGISFSVDAKPGAGFRGDARLIERVLANLLGNAMKFTPPGGRIRLSCRPDGDAVSFCVEDTGPGIPAGKTEEIFQKYSQLEEHKSQGFGLGLAMCRMAVELHGGRIWVESEPGNGSRFFVRLPVSGGGAHG